MTDLFMSFIVRLFFQLLDFFFRRNNTREKLFYQNFCFYQYLPANDLLSCFSGKKNKEGGWTDKRKDRLNRDNTKTKRQRQKHECEIGKI